MYKKLFDYIVSFENNVINSQNAYGNTPGVKENAARLRGLHECFKNITGCTIEEYWYIVHEKELYPHQRKLAEDAKGKLK